MAISKVGTFASASSGSAGTTATLGYTTVNLGDLVAVTSSTSSASSIITALSGGGCTTWTKVTSQSGGSMAAGVSLWYGTVTTVGAVTLTATLGASSNWTIDAFQFTAGFGASTIWALDGTPAAAQVASSSTMTYPSLTAAATGELWYGYVVPANAGSGGAGTGFTFQINNATWTNVIAYQALTTSGAITAPSATQATAGTYIRVGALFTASSGSQNLTPNGIASSSAFGSQSVVQNITPTGLVSGEAFGASSVSPILQATGIASAEVFGASVVDDGLHAFGIATAEAFGSSTVTPGAVTLTPIGMASAEAFGSSTVIPSVLYPNGIGTAAAFGSSTVVPGDVTLTATGIASAEAFGGNVVQRVITELTSAALIARAQITVPYELVCVARIPQTSGAPALIQVDPIDWTGLSQVDELSKPQQLTVGTKIASITEPVLQRLRNLSELATELWLYRNGKLVFAGPLLGGQVQGEALTLQAQGLLAYAKMMVVASDQVMTAVDQFTIAATLIDQWQNLDYGNFGIDTSSVGLSGVTRDATYLAKELNQVGQRLEEMGKRINGFDLAVDPASRKLRLSYPIQGVDRSSGEDAIVFDSRNVTSPNIVFSAAPGDVASEGFGTGTGTASGATTLFSTKSNLVRRAQYGRSAVTATYSDVSVQATLDDYVQGLLDVRNEALLIPGPDVRVTPDSDLSAYDVGDTVSYQLHAQLSVQGTFRLRKRTVNVSNTGQESVSVAFV